MTQSSLTHGVKSVTILRAGLRGVNELLMHVVFHVHFTNILQPGAYGSKSTNSNNSSIFFITSLLINSLNTFH